MNVGSGLAKLVYVASTTAASAAIAAAIRSGHVSDADKRITRNLQAIDNRQFRSLMHAVSWPGFPPQSRIAPWVLPAALLALARPYEATFQLLGWGAGALSWTLKRIMNRPRPDSLNFNVLEVGISGSSFPSAHVMIYTAVCGFFLYLCKHVVPIRWIRRLLSVGLFSMIALVGPSRVYLGHHWASDVLASYLLGTSYLVILTSLYQRFRTRRSAQRDGFVDRL